MRFKKEEKYIRPAPSKRRLAMHTRSVEKEKEKFALFPEMVRYSTAEERIQALDAESDAHEIRFRKSIAKRWKEARRKLKKLPETKQRAVMWLWNRGIYPASSEYFADLVYRAEKGINLLKLCLDFHTNEKRYRSKDRG